MWLFRACLRGLRVDYLCSFEISCYSPPAWPRRFGLFGCVFGFGCYRVGCSVWVFVVFRLGVLLPLSSTN